jgi:hypothetical protein
MMLEKLHLTLMTLRRRHRIKRAQVSAPARARIYFSRIKPVTAGFKFSYHRFLAASIAKNVPALLQAKRTFSNAHCNSQNISLCKIPEKRI